MNKLWLIAFLILPIIGITYATWRTWHILPLTSTYKYLVVGILLLCFLLFFSNLNIFHTDRMPMSVATACYEIGNSSLFILLYLVLLYLLLDLGHALHLVPHNFLYNSTKGSLTVLAVLVSVFTYGYFHYMDKTRQPIDMPTTKKLERPLKIVMASDLHLGYHNQVAELLVTCERARLGGDAFLHVTFGGDDVDVVVEGGGARCCFGVEHAAHTALCVGETNGGCQALAERAGGDFYTLGVLVFGVAGGEGTPGAQGFQVLHFQAVAAEEQLSVQGEGGVAGGEDEAVTAFPAVVGGILVHDLLEEQVGDRRQAHCGAGVAGSDLFYGVCGEDTYGIYGALVGFCPLEVLCHVGVLSQREWMRQQACASALSVGCNGSRQAVIPVPCVADLAWLYLAWLYRVRRGAGRFVSTLSF